MIAKRRDWDEIKANALLIAKAPEMADCLRELWAEIHSGPKHTGLTLVYLDKAERILREAGVAL